MGSTRCRQVIDQVREQPAKLRAGLEQLGLRRAWRYA
jgi:hypothetical protein